MSQLYLLVKTGLLNQWKLQEIKSNRDRKKRNTNVLLLSAYLLVGVMFAVYAGFGAYGLVYIKMGELIPAAALFLAGFVTLVFTIMKTNGILFGYKDYEMLAALPVSQKILVASRFMQLYLGNLLFGMVIMLPMGLVYGRSRGEGILFYGMWLLGTAAAPLIPTTLAAVAGVLIMAAASRMKHSGAVSAVLSIALIAAILVGSMGLGGSAENINIAELSALLESAKQGLWKLYPVSRLFHKAIVEADAASFLLFLAGSYLWYRLFVGLTALWYKKIQSALNAHKTGTGKRGSLNFESRTPLKALVGKEWRRFFNSNIYLLNMGMGVIMMLLAAGALLLLPDQTLTAVFTEGEMSIDISRIGASFAPFLIAGLSGMSCTSCCSLSLEGSNIYMLKALPLSGAQIYKSKIIMNLLLVTPASLLASALMSIRFAGDVADVLFIFLIPLAFNLFTAVWGMYVNIKMPNFSWENEAAVVKQGMPAFLGIFTAMLLALAAGVATGLTKEAFKPLMMLLLTVVTGGAAILLYGHIRKLPLPV